jgi:hypothetical protein
MLRWPIAVGLDCGARVSNLTAPEPKRKDHGIRCGQVTAWRSTNNDCVDKVCAGPLLYELLHDGSEDRAIDGFELTFLTTKTFRTVKKGTPKPVRLLRRSPAEIHLVDDLTEWFRNSPKLQEADYLFTRYAPSTGAAKLPKARFINAASKASVTALGFNPSRFSSKSIRIGFATYANSNSMFKEDRNQRAGWVAGSTVPDVYYDREQDGGGILAHSGSAKSVDTGFNQPDL